MKKYAVRLRRTDLFSVIVEGRDADHAGAHAQNSIAKDPRADDYLIACLGVEIIAVEAAAILAPVDYPRA